ncbi:MAG: glycoside hydrolase family 3 C-terminal domain-containing protein [Spirochaetaceae bacterium]
MADYKKMANDIISDMTVKEKVSQMVHGARGISRLQIPAYNWWNECLHGVGRAGIATVFPQPIGLAAMFDDNFLKEIAEVISDEVRAKYNEVNIVDKKIQSSKLLGKLQAHKLWYRGLTCWSPNINIFRDPRWGRGHETFGEDPYLTSRLGVAFIKGLQGENPEFLKVVATPKHFAVHSGPEFNRHSFNSVVNKKDLYETYLPAFKACIQEGKAASIMTAYNAFNGEPCASSEELLQHILRDEWGFNGFVVSDCGAIQDIRKHHKKTKSNTVAASMAVNAGCDLNCGTMYNFLANAVKKGLVTEDTLDISLTRLFEARIKLGMLSSRTKNPYDEIKPDVINCKKHRDLALEASKKSLVLLKNDGILPLKKEIKKIAVIGPNADSKSVLLGNYSGDPSSFSTILSGIKKSFYGEVLYTQGCHLTKTNTKDFKKVIALAKEADVVILAIGLAPEIEGEEGDAFNSDAAGDKLTIKLPGLQENLIKTLNNVGTPVVATVLAGSALDLRVLEKNSSAIIQAWYPGQDGGEAVAKLIFGEYSPSGRLPVTFVESDSDLPDFEDYSMVGRTYRFLNKPPLYPFGFGLSYTNFDYDNLVTSWTGSEENKSLKVSITVKNTGNIDSDEIVQYYYKFHDKDNNSANFQLCKFSRITLKVGETVTLETNIPLEMFKGIDNNGKSVLRNGDYTIFVGGSGPDKRSEQLVKREVLKLSFKL